ncbi:MAG: response regulator transcription factor [Sphaerochaetaceae bacterium]|jgi:DNA-binding response OmpR family regulator|nr:response regulator transcription factor [Sphaerochaetaceae bacterium]MDD3163269.1 response regulator transcription factor [Sphaerochaetaceae bacterium]MDD4007361.1 response regulator transcription factor [Sphaerochaetaceae bacterium]MDD4396440.1 response regulator transcription factor [Sphaerochaetaceae bacterium]
MKTIYLCEDEPSIRDGVCQYLKLEGYDAKGFGTLSDTQHAISSCEPDLLIQDVMLPDGDGFSFVKKLKAGHSFPVVFLTARTSESDRIIGFELGADDYITKPFSPKELVLRIHALFRRMEIGVIMKSGGMQFSNGKSIMKFDSVAHVLVVDGKNIILTAAEWKVLSYLMENNGVVVSRAQILEHCFDYGLECYDRIVDSHVKNIRSKIGPTSPVWIETVRGYGYRFTGEPF